MSFIHKISRSKGLPSKSFKEHYNLSKLWNRILKPFLLIVLLTGMVLIIVGHNPVEVFKSCIYAGSIGPGSYYVWIYLQFFLLLPFCLTFINTWGVLLILFILISQGVEWICMYIDIPEPIYRLSLLRYIFLIYLGYVWSTNRMSQTLSVKQIVLSLISLVILLGLYYTSGSLQPFLYDTLWRPYYWICYFYTAFLLPWLIWKIYWKLSLKIREFVGEIGKCSYEIYLVQMSVFTLYPHTKLSVGNYYVDMLIFIVTSMLISIIPVLLYVRYKGNLGLSSRTR